MKWVSAAEATRYVEIVAGFTEKIRALGPLAVSEGLEKEVFTFKLEAAKALSQQEKFRWILAKTSEFSKEGNAYGEIFTQQELDRLLQGVIIEDLKVHEILKLLETGALSVKEIAQKLKILPEDVLRQITALRRKRLVDLKEVKERTPRYTLYQKKDRKDYGC